MNFKEELKQRVQGMTSDQVVDALFDTGAIDHHLARRHVVVVEFGTRYSSTDRSARDVQEDLSYEYGVTRRHILNYVSGK